MVSELNVDVAQKEPKAKICGCDEKSAVKFICRRRRFPGSFFVTLHFCRRPRTNAGEVGLDPDQRKRKAIKSYSSSSHF